MNKKKTIITSLAVIVIAAGGYWIFGGPKLKKKVDFPHSSKTGNISNSITATGTIEPVTKYRSEHRFPVLSTKSTLTTIQ